MLRLIALTKHLPALEVKPVLTPIQYEVVSKWNDNDLTRYAIRKAVLNNKFSINYIDKILYSYEKNNIKSVQQAVADDEEFNDKRNNYYKNKYQKKFMKVIKIHILGMI